MSATSSASDAPNTSSASSPRTESYSTLSAGAIAGIVIGVVSILLILVGVSYLLWRRRRLRGVPSQEDGNSRARDTKEINPSPKQVLGLDDESYLNRLPVAELGSQEIHGMNSEILSSESYSSNKFLELTAAPAYVKPQLDKIRLISRSRWKPSDPAPDHRSLASDGVNPWDVELTPNSIIFPHLRDPTVAESSTMVDHNLSNLRTFALPASSHVVDSSRSPDAVVHGMIVQDPESPMRERLQTPEQVHPTVEPEMIEVSSSDTAQSNSSTTEDDTTQTLSSSTTASTTSPVDKGKSPVFDTAIVGHNLDLTISIPGYHHPTILAATSPMAETIIEAHSVTHLAYNNTHLTCSKCDQAFRTAGLLRYLNTLP